MGRESAFLIVLLILLTVSLSSAIEVQSVKASGTIYIRANGSIDPPTAPIYTVDNVTYTLTGNITADTDGIVIERDNIVVDGAGYTVTGSGKGNGAALTNRSNVTARNMTIKNFSHGIWLDSSPNNNLSGNNISGNEEAGIWLYSSPNNVLSGNAVEGSQPNLLISGGTLNDYLHSIDTSNMVDNKPVYYFINQSDMVVDTDTYPKVGYLGFVNCVNVTVQALNLTENGDGLLLAFTNNSKITGNNVTNQYAGICLKYSFNITLSDNNITNNRYGVRPTDSSNITLSDNNITNNVCGVQSYDSSNITLSGNDITYNSLGVYTDHSSNNTLSSNNIAYNNGSGIMLFWSSSNNTLSGNNVTNNGNGIELWQYSSYNTLSGNNVANNNGEGIGLAKSIDNTLSGNNVANNGNGIGLYFSIHNTLSGNNVANNGNGIILSEPMGRSRDNSVFGNNIVNNRCGMNLSGCSDNRIFHNNFLNNTEQASNSSVNVWDDGYPSGGNYWSDYNGTDANHDGIGDTPYVIDENNTDHYPLVNPYRQSGTVYIRADGSIDPPDAAISTFDDVTYTLTGNIASDAHGIVVLRDNIVVDGSGFSIEGTGLEYYSGIYFSEIGNVTIRNTNIKNFHYGIQSNSSSNNSISGNNITTNSVFGIMLISSSSNNTISGNTITSDYGIRLDSSSNNSISGNNITSRGVGIGLYGSSDYNDINGNNVTNNGYYGICLDSSSNNSVNGNTITNNHAGILLRFSSNNSVGENTIKDNGEGIGLESAISNVISGNNITNNHIFGVELDASSNNTIYHNNFVSNAQQVYVSPNSSANVWDDGYPSGGNYWSDYNGTDADHDGIGDTPYVIDANNTDIYPLMGMFSEFDWVSLAAPEQRIQTICNSTISDLVYNGTAISFNVTGEDGTTGFCRIRIPTILLNVTYKVFVNGTEATYRLLPFSNETYRYLYFNYTHSTQEVTIIPEFPSFLILPFIMMATLLAVIIYKKKGVKTSRSQTKP